MYWSEIIEFVEILIWSALALACGFGLMQIVCLFGLGGGNDEDKPVHTPYMDEDGNFWDHPPYERRAQKVSDRDHHNTTERSRALNYGYDSYIDFDGYKRNAKTGKYMYMNQTNTPNPRRK